jgi:antitoxin FitA
MGASPGYLCVYCFPSARAPDMTNLASNEFSWELAATSLLQSLITVISLIAMASITIRKLPEGTKRRLRIRAARKGHSMEQEARELLQSALAQAEAQPENLGRQSARYLLPWVGLI